MRTWDTYIFQKNNNNKQYGDILTLKFSGPQYDGGSDEKIIEFNATQTNNETP